MNDNDTILEQIIRGDTLEAINRLYARPDSEDDATMALNRVLYGPPTHEALERVRAEEERHLERLGQSDDAEQADLLYNLGCFALFQDDVSEARLRFAEALRHRGDHLMARHNLAYALELMAETAEARAEYERVLAANPDSAISQLNLALLDLHEGRYEAGLERLERMHGDDPDNIGLVLYLCRGLLLRGTARDLEGVLDLIDQQPDAERYPDLRECRAYALYLLGEQEAAERAFSELLAENEGNLFARLGLIKVLAAQGNFDALKPHVARYHELNPGEEMAGLLAELDDA